MVPRENGCAKIESKTTYGLSSSSFISNGQPTGKSIISVSEMLGSSSSLIWSSSCSFRPGGYVWPTSTSRARCCWMISGSLSVNVDVGMNDNPSTNIFQGISMPGLTTKDQYQLDARRTK